MLSKKCIQCKSEFQKKYNRSVIDFLQRAKFCSKECANDFRHYKPSCSPQTTFKIGHKPSKLAIEIARRRFTGASNPRWNGGLSKLICKICQKDFMVKPYEVEKRKFCSIICRKEHEKSPERRVALSEINRRRVKLGLHNLYRGISDLKDIIRHSVFYKLWRDSVFIRDDYTCQFCYVRGNELNADHIKQFSVILVENDIKTFDDAIQCRELWNVENGRTLCVSCHRKTETWGRFIPAFSNKIKLTTNNL